MHHKQISANFKAAKVLVIEDNADQWLLIRQAMQQCLPEVSLVWVSSPQQAIAQLEAWHHQEWDAPKLILMDLYLPARADGWMLLAQIKAMPAPFHLIPLIMLSASCQPADIQQAYVSGAAAYLIKPLTAGEWLSQFEQIRTYWWETVALVPMQYNLQL